MPNCARCRYLPISPHSDRKAIWVHGNGDTRCYPESSSPEDAAATAEPINGRLHLCRSVTSANAFVKALTALFR